MIDGFAAGHSFKFGVCACGRKLVDLQDLTSADVNKPDISHAGNSTLYEIDQINALVLKMKEHVNVCFGWRD